MVATPLHNHKLVSNPEEGTRWFPVPSPSREGSSPPAAMATAILQHKDLLAVAPMGPGRALSSSQVRLTSIKAPYLGL